MLTCATGCMVTLFTDIGNSLSLGEKSLIWYMSNLILMGRVFMKRGVTYQKVRLGEERVIKKVVYKYRNRRREELWSWLSMVFNGSLLC